VKLLDRYIVRQAVGPLLLAVILLCAVIWALQLLRLGHHLAGGGELFVLLGRAVPYSLPTLLVFVLPLASAAAVVYCLGRLTETRQLLAMQLAGVAPLQLVRPLLALVLLAGATAALASHLEPPALRALQRATLRHAGQALVEGLRPGRFRDLGGGTTIYVERRLPGTPPQFAGLLVGRDDGALLARRAKVRLVGEATIEIDLVQAEWHGRNAEGQPVRVRARRLRQRLDLGHALRPHFGFLARRATRGPRPLPPAVACVALGLIAALVALRSRSRLQGAALAALAVALYLFVAELCKAVEPTTGPLALGLIVSGGSLWAIARPTLRRR